MRGSYGLVAASPRSPCPLHLKIRMSHGSEAIGPISITSVPCDAHTSALKYGHRHRRPMATNHASSLPHPFSGAVSRQAQGCARIECDRSARWASSPIPRKGKRSKGKTCISTRKTVRRRLIRPHRQNRGRRSWRGGPLRPASWLRRSRRNAFAHSPRPSCEILPEYGARAGSPPSCRR